MAQTELLSSSSFLFDPEADHSPYGLYTVDREGKLHDHFVVEHPYELVMHEDNPICATYTHETPDGAIITEDIQIHRVLGIFDIQPSSNAAFSAVFTNAVIEYSLPGSPNDRYEGYSLYGYQMSSDSLLNNVASILPLIEGVSE